MRHEACHRRRQLGSRQGQKGAVHRGGRGLHFRMVLDLRAIDAGAIGGKLLLSREQPGLRRRHRIARMLQFLTGNRTTAGQAFATRQILLRGVEVGLPNGLRRGQLRRGGEQAAHRAHGQRQVRLGLIECDLGIGRIQAHQGLSRGHVLGVIGIDADHGAGDLRCDLDDIAVHIGIVGGLAKAQHGLPVDAVADGDDEDGRA